MVAEPPDDKVRGPPLILTCRRDTPLRHPARLVLPRVEPLFDAHGLMWCRQIFVLAAIRTRLDRWQSSPRVLAGVRKTILAYFSESSR